MFFVSHFVYSGEERSFVIRLTFVWSMQRKSSSIYSRHWSCGKTSDAILFDIEQIFFEKIFHRGQFQVEDNISFIFLIWCRIVWNRLNDFLLRWSMGLRSLSINYSKSVMNSKIKVDLLGEWYLIRLHERSSSIKKEKEYLFLVWSSCLLKWIEEKKKKWVMADLFLAENSFGDEYGNLVLLGFFSLDRCAKKYSEDNSIKGRSNKHKMTNSSWTLKKKFYHSLVVFFSLDVNWNCVHYFDEKEYDLII